MSARYLIIKISFLNKGFRATGLIIALYLFAFSQLQFNGLLAQEYLKRQKKFADSLFSKKDYFRAITEYKRLKFFDSNGSFNFVSDFKIALSYKGGAKFKEAANYFNLALAEANNDSEEFTANIELVKTLIIARRTTRALAKINSLKKIYYGNKRKELQYWQGWAFMFAEKWVKADSVFRIIGETKLDSVCKNVLNERYSLTVAKIFSYLMPGAGQLYAGHPWSGLMSFAWNALWGYLTLKAFFAERYFDGIVIGNLLWFRFYRGNLQNAERFARRENKKIYNNAYDYLQFKFKGKKL